MDKLRIKVIMEQYDAVVHREEEYNVEAKDLQGESSITVEHVQNNSTVREMLGQRGIRPEELPASEDIKKLERRVKSQEKKLAAQSAKLPEYN